MALFINIVVLGFGFSSCYCEVGVKCWDFFGKRCGRGKGVEGGDPDTMASIGDCEIGEFRVEISSFVILRLYFGFYALFLFLFFFGEY